MTDAKGRGYGVRAGSPLGCFPSRPLRTGTGPWRRSFWRHAPAGIPFERERFEYEREYDTLFTGFGFPKEDKKKRISQFFRLGNRPR